MPQELISDGTVSWLGGLDTSRSPTDIGEAQYSKASNVIIPSSLGGIRSRFGLHCSRLNFESKETKLIYSKGNIQGEGSFTVNDNTYLICVVDGYVLKFTKTASNSFNVSNINIGNRNISNRCNSWVIPIPGGCIINNGFDTPLYVNNIICRRTDPSKGEIGIGQMGVYVQHRLFYVDQSGRRILASDFMQPLKLTLEDTNIFGFMCPDDTEKIVAIAKQKSIIGTVEGGNLIWSSNKDIYSVDVRGTRSEWANLNTKVGKVTETIPGFAAVSSYSFESFNTNIYFRSAKYGIADIKQSEYQFVNLDSITSQAIEASYYLDNDTDWMLDRCYTRSCNKRMFTTVAPERNDKGYVYWNGLLSFHPAAIYSNQGNTPRRFESVFTGVRPTCITVVNTDGKDQMFIHSYDKDGINRMYFMDENSDYDVDSFGSVKEIEGFIETRAYTLKNPLMLKNPDKRFYRLNLTERSINIKVFARPEVNGEWSPLSDLNHLICRNKIVDNVFYPASHKGQTRPFVNLKEEKFSQCYKYGNKYLAIQYRIEFKGPLNFDSIITVASISSHDLTVTQPEKECIILSYAYRPDYNYSIATILP